MMQLAKLVGDIATGEAQDEAPLSPIGERAAKGGAARAAKLTRAKRVAIARNAARKRWDAR